ncbi:MAG: hypothetical protein KBS34_05645, partial [Phascolarctobacterium sp.]|nr:hypothetical protein [Candidatus Phascolarctobacterium equi]
SGTSGLFMTYGTDAKTNTLKIADGVKLYIKDAVAGTKYNLFRNTNIGSVDSPNWAVGNPWFTDLNSTETAKNIFTSDDLIRFVRTLHDNTSQQKFQYTLQAVTIGTTNLTVSDGGIGAFTNNENVTTTVNADQLLGAVTNSGTIGFVGGTLVQGINGGAVTIADEKKLTVGDGGSISASITGNALDLGNHEWTVTGQSKLKKLTAGSTGAESIIFMNADKSMVIGEYSGQAKVFYEHSNDGDEASDYAASAVKIKSAAADSVIL